MKLFFSTSHQSVRTYCLESAVTVQSSQHFHRLPKIFCKLDHTVSKKILLQTMVLKTITCRKQIIISDDVMTIITQAAKKVSQISQCFERKDLTAHISDSTDTHFPTNTQKHTARPYKTYASLFPTNSKTIIANKSKNLRDSLPLRS